MIVLLVIEDVVPATDRAAIEQRIKARVLREIPSIDIPVHIDVNFGEVADRTIEMAEAH